MASYRLFFACIVFTVISACTDNELPTNPSLSVRQAVAGRPQRQLQFKSLSPGTQTTCGLAVNGKGYCWGLNNYGQLGDGTTDYLATRPRPLAGNCTFSQISFSYQHGCGVSQSRAYCWGSNSFGQLGNPGSVTISREPISVKGSWTFSKVTTGFFHTCGIGQASFGSTDNVGACWGDIRFGQLGNNGSYDSENRPQQISNGVTTGIILPIPHSLSLYWIEASALGTCALSEGVDTLTGLPSGLPGHIKCWGFNNGNVFGLTSWTIALVPERVLADLDQSGTQLSLFNVGACAISLGDSFCWGGTSSGETGDGTFVYRPEPTPVIGPSFISISSGSSHSCGVTGAGDAYCWGANHRGQLGDGTTTGSPLPVKVAGGLKFKEIYAAGANPFAAFTCGLTRQGEAYCWGGNEVGELGDGTTIDRLIPTRVLDPQ